MEKEKQIDEIYQEILTAEREFSGKPVLDIEKYVAEHLYTAGYRKERQGEWISVEDRLPEERTTVLVYVGDRFVATDFILNGMWYGSSEKVTHWMPLPAPPKMKGAE